MTYRKYPIGVTKIGWSSILKKTKVVIVTTRQKWQHINKKDVNVCIKEDKLQVVESDRQFGFHVDNFLTWKTHIQNILTTIAGKFAFLCRTKQYLPYKTKNTFYNSYILPDMDYCSTLWGNATTSDTFCRIITHSEYRAPSDPLLEQLNLLPLPQRIKYIRCWFIKQ